MALGEETGEVVSGVNNVRVQSTGVESLWPQGCSERKRERGQPAAILGTMPHASHSRPCGEGHQATEMSLYHAVFAQRMLHISFT